MLPEGDQVLRVAVEWRRMAPAGGATQQSATTAKTMIPNRRRAGVRLLLAPSDIPLSREECYSYSILFIPGGKIAAWGRGSTEIWAIFVENHVWEGRSSC